MGLHDVWEPVKGCELPPNRGAIEVKRGKGMVAFECRIGTNYYRRNFVRCGRKTCWCKDKQRRQLKGLAGHGPYWYRLIDRDGVWVKRYLGKDLIINGKILVILGDEYGDPQIFTTDPAKGGQDV